jgi:ubiquinone/menaquinone biosynthesis C-methylase UbiE
MTTPDPAVTHEATHWFEPLYAAAARGEGAIPWDRHAPHPLLVRWADLHAPNGTGKAAVVVGCGTGDDAALVATLGYRTTAFDVSPSAIATARARHPDTRIDFQVADLFALPPAWERAFDLVIESQTVQALPRELRGEAIAQVTRLAGPGGTLLVLAAGTTGTGPDPGDGPPWPLSREDVDLFGTHGLYPVAIELERDTPGATYGRWSAEFHRPS